MYESIKELIIESLIADLPKHNIVIEIRESYPRLTCEKIEGIYVEAEKKYLREYLENKGTRKKKYEKIAEQNVLDGIKRGMYCSQIMSEYNYCWKIVADATDRLLQDRKITEKQYYRIRKPKSKVI